MLEILYYASIQPVLDHINELADERDAIRARPGDPIWQHAQDLEDEIWGLGHAAFDMEFAWYKITGLGMEL